MLARADIGTVFAILAIVSRAPLGATRAAQKLDGGAGARSHLQRDPGDPDPADRGRSRRGAAARHGGRQIDARSALRLYRSVARENRRRRDSGDTAWAGIAYSLDPAVCGKALGTALLHIKLSNYHAIAIPSIRIRGALTGNGARRLRDLPRQTRGNGDSAASEFTKK
jgi:hypothetical protein